MSVRKYGYKPSPEDAKGTHDLYSLPRVPNHLKLAAAPLPASVDNSNLVPRVFDQGGAGSCVGHGTAEAIWGELVREWKAAGSTGEFPECPSRAWNYWLGRVHDGDPNLDNGTYVSSVFEMLAKYGFIRESAWQYSDQNLTPPKSRIPALQRLAFKQRLVTGTARITSIGAKLIAELKTALAAGYLVVFGTQVDMAFENLGRDAVWPGCKGQSLGGHCMLVTGFRTINGRTQFRIRNSWGTGWCDNGSCWFDEAATVGFDDVWVVSAAPKYGLIRRVFDKLRGAAPVAALAFAAAFACVGAKCVTSTDPVTPVIVVDAGSDVVACATACCTTCATLATHNCEEGQPLPYDTPCEAVCLNAEDGPSEMQWAKLPDGASLETIRKSYECLSGK